MQLASHTGKCLASLDFSSNSIGIGGGEALAEVVIHVATLRELHLGFNLLRLGGASALANALEASSSALRWHARR